MSLYHGRDYRPIAGGGLMKCCEESIRLYEAQGGDLSEGTEHPCRYGCHSVSVIRDGVWRFREP